jgi:hypothetical protein
VGTGESVVASGAGPPPGTAEWFVVNSVVGTTTFNMATTSGDSGARFDVYTDCLGTAVFNSDPNGGNILDIPVYASATWYAPSTMYIKIYVPVGFGTGTYTLTLNGPSPSATPLP